MSDTNDQRDGSERSETSPPPYPRTVGGVVVWIGVAVALLGYVGFSVYRKAKRFEGVARRGAEREARVTIARLRAAQTTYRSEHGVYLATTSRGENDFYPAPAPEPKRRRFQPRIDRRPGWAVLAPAMPRERLYCGYVIVAGPAGSLARAGPHGRGLFANRPPSTPWYYIRARCIQGAGRVLVFESTSASERIVLQR